MALSSRPGAAESPATGQRDQGPEGLLSTVKPLVGTGGGGGFRGRGCVVPLFRQAAWSRSELR